MNDKLMTVASEAQTATTGRSSTKSVLLLAFTGAAFAAWILVQLQLT